MGGGEGEEGTGRSARLGPAKKRLCASALAAAAAAPPTPPDRALPLAGVGAKAREPAPHARAAGNNRGRARGASARRFPAPPATHDPGIFSPPSQPLPALLPPWLTRKVSAPRRAREGAGRRGCVAACRRGLITESRPDSGDSGWRRELAAGRPNGALAPRERMRGDDASARARASATLPGGPPACGDSGRRSPPPGPRRRPPLGFCGLAGARRRAWEGAGQHRAGRTGNGVSGWGGPRTSGPRRRRAAVGPAPWEVKTTQHFGVRIGEPRRGLRRGFSSPPVPVR